MDTSDSHITLETRARYDRNARFYDLLTRGSERMLEPGRAELWRRVRGPRVLEVGVGTGRGMAHYRPELGVTAIDFSPRMLAQARQRAAREQIMVDLREADVQALPFPDASFDTVIATCVFCSVPDPILGLRELRRVLVLGGQLLLLEHVLSHRPLLSRAMRLLNPLVVRLSGANINRETVENVRRAGFAGYRLRIAGSTWSSRLRQQRREPCLLRECNPNQFFDRPSWSSARGTNRGSGAPASLRHFSRRCTRFRAELTAHLPNGALE